nr:rna polymerase ii subunit a c-terminal domain phosphatase [Quercus suber]
MKIISERGFPQDDYDDFDDTPEENTEKTYLHPCVFRGKCVSCETVALKYVHQGMWLWLSKDEMDRIRKVESAKLLQDKKIVLVLDLDQTLVHSTEQEKYLKTPQELLQHELRDSLFRLESTLGKDDAQFQQRCNLVEPLKYENEKSLKYEMGLTTRKCHSIMATRRGRGWRRHSVGRLNDNRR